MSKHTPAPWHVDIEETWPADAPCFITAYSGGPLCIVDNREDARLIAAAPDLLEALELISDIEPDPSNMGRFHDIANAAVAKARGEE